MAIQLILIILVLLLVFFLAFKLFKGLIKALFSVGIILVLLLLVVGFVIYSDISSLNKGLKEDKVFIILHDAQFVTAFSVKEDLSLSRVVFGEVYESLSVDVVDSLLEKYNDDSFSEEDGLVLLLNNDLFFNKSSSVLDDVVFSEELLINLVESNSLEEVEVFFGDFDFFTQSQFLSVYDLRNKVYFELLKSEMKSSKGKFLVEGLKSKDVVVRPELLSSKLLNFVPDKLLGRFLNVEG